MPPAIATLRPRQWVKNAFVLLPLVFSRNLDNAELVIRAGIAALAFCLLSGAIYTLNDIRDIESDRAHPLKRSRPVASGDLSVSAAWIIVGTLIPIAIAACAILSPLTAIAAASYAGLNIAYSMGLKDIPYFDVALIAGGFLLRVFAGGLAIEVAISPWLLICTGLLSALLGMGKRAHELVWARRNGLRAHRTRKSLRGYSLPMLRGLLTLFAIATTVAYSLYTRDERTLATFGTGDLLYTVPLVALGILRFLDLTLWHPRTHSPTEAMLRDIVFLAIGASWTAAAIVIIYR